jgi:hypothetical protein
VAEIYLCVFDLVQLAARHKAKFRRPDRNTFFTVARNHSGHVKKMANGDANSNCLALACGSQNNRAERLSPSSGLEDAAIRFPTTRVEKSNGPVTEASESVWLFGCQDL